MELTERSKLLNDELNLLAYEQRKLNEYKQKEGASQKAIETQQLIIEQRLARYNRLNEIYDDMELDLKKYVIYFKKKSISIGLTKSEKIEIINDAIISLQKQIEIENKDYQAANTPLEENCATIKLVCSQSLLRSYNNILKILH